MLIFRKTEQEIELMRESCQIVSDVHEMLAGQIKPGVTTLELDSMAEDYIRSRDARPAFKGYASGARGVPPFPGTLCISINDEVVHGIPSNRKIEDGQIVSVDVGVEKNGYFGDGAFTHAVGTVDMEVLRLMNVTRESLHLGIAQACPGNHLHDISAAIQKHVESNGFSIVVDLVGHGIGRHLHEDPPVPNYGKRGNGPMLKEGMTLAIEPMVNQGNFAVRFAANGWTVSTRDHSMSAHYEHTVLISKDGPVLLTNHFENSHV
jgi:methionyl aminopeptidase